MPGQRDLHCFAAPAAERKYVIDHFVGARLQAVEVLRLSGKTRVVYFDVVKAVLRKRDLDSGVQVEQRAVVGTRDQLARAVEHSNDRIDGRPAATRIDFEYALLAGL